jgi:hypothetical protein
MSQKGDTSMDEIMAKLEAEERHFIIVQLSQWNDDGGAGSGSTEEEIERLLAEWRKTISTGRRS